MIKVNHKISKINFNLIVAVGKICIYKKKTVFEATFKVIIFITILQAIFYTEFAGHFKGINCNIFVWFLMQ